MFKKIIIVVICLCILGIIYYTGYTFGYTKCDNIYKESQINLLKQVETLNNDLNLKIYQYNELNKKYIQDLADKTKEYEININNIKHNYAMQLQQSESRASLYRQMSEAGETQSRYFTDYVSRLDRSLTEGIQLVNELTATIKLRDEQIKRLINQLQEDRNLINGTRD